MTPWDTFNPDKFEFRGLHPKVRPGTASDRYSGWIGQIYTADRYTGRITKRSHTVGGKSFVENVLPVDSVGEYFEHFRVLEIDYTFYHPLLGEDGQISRSHKTLEAYRNHMGKGDLLILKAPQIVFARKVRRGGVLVENEAYLNPETFTRRFYEPAVRLLGTALGGIIFEQEYQPRQDRTSTKEMAARLDAFFGSIPEDGRYHVELRTESFLSTPVFEVLREHGVGQVLSHWTWLPSLRKQFAKAGGKFFNSGKQGIIRLMTPRGVKYQDAYAKAHPFDRLIDGMIDVDMVGHAVEIAQAAIGRGVTVNVIINNRSGGNAPMIAQLVAGELRAKIGDEPESGPDRSIEAAEADRDLTSPDERCS